MTEETPEKKEQTSEEKPDYVEGKDQAEHSVGSTRNRIISILKSKIFKWCVIVFCVIFLIAFIILSAINHSYKKDIIKNSEELAEELENFVTEKYGDLSVKKNGWAYVAGLSKMDCISYEVLGVEEYEELSLSEKKKKLTDLGAFKFCEDLEHLKDYDVIVPEWFHPFDIDDFDQLLLGEPRLNFLKIKDTVNCLMVCADWYFENSEKEKGIELLKRGLGFVEMLPMGDLIHDMMRVAFSQILLDHVRKHFTQYSKDELEYLEREISRTCLLEPIDYYSFWLFEAYSTCAFMLDEDMLKEMEKYRSNWDLGFISWFLENLFCTNRLIADSITNSRKCYAIFKKNISAGNYVKGGEELQELIDELQKKPFSHVISIIALPSLVKSMTCNFENDANTLLMLLSIKAKLYKYKHGVFPAVFNDFVKESEYEHLRISNDGREIKFRGYKIGFIEKMSDETEYGSDENRRDHSAFYATPLSHGNTGELVFISNETGLIYYKDTGSAFSVTDWPVDLKAAEWAIVQ